MRDMCEDCVHYDYDEEYDAYVCDAALDEDEMEKFLSRSFNGCPYYRRGDDYTLARRQ